MRASEAPQTNHEDVRRILYDFRRGYVGKQRSSWSCVSFRRHECSSARMPPFRLDSSKAKRGLWKRQVSDVSTRTAEPVRIEREDFSCRSSAPSSSGSELKQAGTELTNLVYPPPPPIPSNRTSLRLHKQRRAAS